MRATLDRRDCELFKHALKRLKAWTFRDIAKVVNHLCEAALNLYHKATAARLLLSMCQILTGANAGPIRLTGCNK